MSARMTSAKKGAWVDGGRRMRRMDLVVVVVVVVVERD